MARTSSASPPGKKLNPSADSITHSPLFTSTSASRSNDAKPQLTYASVSSLAGGGGVSDKKSASDDQDDEDDAAPPPSAPKTTPPSLFFFFLRTRRLRFFRPDPAAPCFPHLGSGSGSSPPALFFPIIVSATAAPPASAASVLASRPFLGGSTTTTSAPSTASRAASSARATWNRTLRLARSGSAAAEWRNVSSAARATSTHRSDAIGEDGEGVVVVAFESPPRASSSSSSSARLASAATTESPMAPAPAYISETAAPRGTALLSAASRASYCAALLCMNDPGW